MSFATGLTGATAIAFALVLTVGLGGCRGHVNGNSADGGSPSEASVVNDDGNIAADVFDSDSAADDNESNNESAASDGESLEGDVTSEGGNCASFVQYHGGQSPSACSAFSALCGNGHIDSCTYPLGSEAGSDANATLIEDCDRADLGCETCVQLGFSGGALACNANCYLDASLCETCAAGTRVSCPSPPFLSNVSTERLALAASDSQVALVWKDLLNSSWHFRRMARDFSVLSDTTLPAGFAASSVASTPTGWLISEVGSHVSLVSLDPAGAVRGSRDIASLAPNGGYNAPLIASPAGRSLLIWVDGLYAGWHGTLHAQVVGEDGSAVGAETQVGNSSETHTSVFVGDGFELAAPVLDPNSGYPTIQLVHIALDGSARMDAAIAGAWMQSLAWFGSEVRIAYQQGQSSQPSPFLQRVTAGGALIGGPMPIAGTYYVNDAMFNWMGAIGNDMAMWSWRAPRTSGDLVRLSLSGSEVWRVPVVRMGWWQVTVMAMTLQGSDAIVAWANSSDRVDLARIQLMP